MGNGGPDYGGGSGEHCMPVSNVELVSCEGSGRPGTGPRACNVVSCVAVVDTSWSCDCLTVLPSTAYGHHVPCAWGQARLPRIHPLTHHAYGHVPNRNTGRPPPSQREALTSSTWHSVFASGITSCRLPSSPGFHKLILYLPDCGLTWPFSKCACHFQCIFKFQHNVPAR